MEYNDVVMALISYLWLLSAYGTSHGVFGCGQEIAVGNFLTTPKNTVNEPCRGEDS